MSVLRIVAVLAVGLLVGGCASPIAGHPVAGNVTKAAEPQKYVPPSDGRGFSSEFLDQPTAVPAYSWRTGQDVCAWVSDDLKAKLSSPTAKVLPGGPACHVSLDGGEDLQITWFEGYHSVDDLARFMRGIDIAGLEAREFAFRAMAEGDCTVDVNTRGLTHVHVLVWHPQKQPPVEPEARCKKARAAADAIVRKFVPLAGGTPWSATPQRPGPQSLTGRDACKVVTKSAALFALLDSDSGETGRTSEGETCTYSSDDAKGVALLTTRGLSDLPPQVDGAEVTERKLGGLPARQEDAGDTCAVAVEIIEGRVLHVTYETTDDSGVACKAAEILAVLGVASLLRSA